MWKGTRDAFAAVVPAADSQITVNLRYAGQYADAKTGLYYNGFRYYDPLTGRYLQPDPLGLSGGLNSYTYALNNPLRYIDPEGQHPVAILLIWTARFAVGWAIDYLIGYLPDNECNPLLSPQRWANAASYAIGISAAQKEVKALTAAAKLRRGLGGAGKGTTGTTTNGYKFSNGSDKVIAKTDLEHPIVQSRINIQNGDNKAGWTHVIQRHFSGKANASQFTISESEVKTILQSKDVAKVPISKTQNSKNKATGQTEVLYERVITLDRNVGIDKFSGNPTNTMTILTDKKGNLITTTPGRL